MGKRSNYERIPRDFYPTPREAVLPLIPHLRGIRTFAEPCCGDGALVRHLESFGLRCVYAGDIHDTGQDALDLTPADINGAPIITNPPFSRESQPLLRRLIATLPEHRSGDVAVASGGLCLEPVVRALPAPVHRHRRNRPRSLDRGHEGQQHENFAWYRFDTQPFGRPDLSWTGAVPVSSRVSLCGQCGKSYRPQRSDSRFCSDTCRQRAHRSRLAVTSRDNA